MSRRDFLKGMILGATGLLVPAISYPVEPKSIIPTPSRPLDTLGYLRIEFYSGESVLFIVDESWVAMRRTPRGFAIEFRSIDYCTDRERIVVGASILTVGGDVIRQCKMDREIYLAPTDTIHLTVAFYADFT